jgi:hypothetical protein
MGAGIALSLGVCTGLGGPKWGLIATLLLVSAAAFALHLRFVLFVLAAIAPLQVTIDVPGFGIQPTMIAGLAVFAICLGAIAKSGRVKRDPSRLGLLLSAFFVLAVLDSVLGIWPRWSVTRIIHLWTYLGLFLSTLWLLRGTEDAMRLVRLIIAAAVIVGLIGAALHSMQFVVGQRPARQMFMYGLAPVILGAKRAASFEVSTVWYAGVEDAPVRAGGPFFWPFMFAMYLEMTLPLLLARIAFVSRAKPAWWHVAGAVVLIFCVAATYVRGAWVTFPFAAAAWYAAKRAGLRPRRAVVWLFIGAIFFLFLSSSLLGRGALWTRLRATWQPDYYSNAARLRTLASGARLVIEHPVTGVGPGNFWSAVSDTPPGELAKPNTNADNLYMTVASEMGLLGLACLVLLLIRLIWCAAQVARQSQDEAVKAVAVGLVGAFVWVSLNSITADCLYEHRLFAVFWILAGVVAVLYRSVRQSAAAP